MISAIHHIGIAVHDLEEARHFWGEVLGLEEVARPKAIEKYTSAWYQIGDAQFHVVENKEFVAPKGELIPHIAVAVRREAFDGVAERVREAGVRIGFGPAAGLDGLYRLVVDDATGNRVEITAVEDEATSSGV